MYDGCTGWQGHLRQLTPFNSHLTRSRVARYRFLEKLLMLGKKETELLKVAEQLSVSLAVLFTAHKLATDGPQLFSDNSKRDRRCSSPR